MAFQLDYTHPQHGTNYPTAHAVVGCVNLAKCARVAVAEMLIFRDATSYANGEQPVNVIQYKWQSADFDNLFETAILEPVDTDPYGQVYAELKSDTERYPTWDGATDLD